MQLLQITLLSLLTSYVAAVDDLDNGDIPTQCLSTCQTLLTTSQTCERQNNDNDRGYLTCVCGSTDASSLITSCEACVSNFDNDRSDNDVNDLLRSCNLTATPFNSASLTVTQATNTNLLTTTPNPFQSTRVPTAGSSITTTNAQGSTTVIAATANVVQPTNTGNAAAGLGAERMNGMLFGGGILGVGLLGLGGFA